VAGCGICTGRRIFAKIVDAKFIGADPAIVLCGALDADACGRTDGFVVGFIRTIGAGGAFSWGSRTDGGKDSGIAEGFGSVWAIAIIGAFARLLAGLETKAIVASLSCWALAICIASGDTELGHGVAGMRARLHLGCTHALIADTAAKHRIASFSLGTAEKTRRPTIWKALTKRNITDLACGTITRTKGAASLGFVLLTAIGCACLASITSHERTHPRSKENHPQKEKRYPSIRHIFSLFHEPTSLFLCVVLVPNTLLPKQEGAAKRHA
jgi:hypothetical protein